ncbi:hypothetical protein HDU76_001315 [Blyttiomyces sp. JEL0837]|nr:hypothetical protein HDU76_001315 [Blyttiomyces sp. JEL0837]
MTSSSSPAMMAIDQSHLSPSLANLPPETIIRNSSLQAIQKSLMNLTSASHTCKWHSESLPWTVEPNILTQKTRRWLMLGNCIVDLHEFAITPDHLVEYLTQFAQKAVFGSIEDVPLIRSVFSIFDGSFNNLASSPSDERLRGRNVTPFSKSKKCPVNGLFHPLRCWTLFTTFGVKQRRQ